MELPIEKPLTDELKTSLKKRFLLIAVLQLVAGIVALTPRVYIIINRYESDYYPSDRSKYCNIFNVFNHYEIQEDYSWLAALILMGIIASVILMVKSSRNGLEKLKYERLALVATPFVGYLLLCTLVLAPMDKEQGYAVDYSNGGRKILWNDSYHVNGIVLGASGIIIAILLSVVLVVAIMCFLTEIKREKPEKTMASGKSDTDSEEKSVGVVQSADVIRKEDDVIKTLDKLKELLDMQAITPEEFDVIKKELLNDR